MKNRILKKFELTDVEIELLNGVLTFELYSVGMALGYIKSNTIKGKTYYQCRKDRVKKVLENAGIKPLVHNGLILLTEEQLYDFMLEAHTDKCKPFRKWIVKEILPMVERTGAYIETGREEEMISKYFPSFSEETKTKMVNDLVKQNHELKEFYDQLMNTEGLMPMNTVAKELEIGEHKLFSFLREQKVLFYDKNHVNIPYERFRKEGKFAVKETPCKDGQVRSVTYVTKKGLDYIRKLLTKSGYYKLMAS